MEDSTSAGGNIIMSLERRPSRSGKHAKHMPWFGLDIGGTLVKVVFFDPCETFSHEEETLTRTRTYLKSSRAYGTTGKRDDHLKMACDINGREGNLHFIRFSTSQMPEFIRMAKEKGLAELIDDVCATGGGANKFEDDLKSKLNIRLRKSDELDSVIYGIHFIHEHNKVRECYYIQDPLDDDKRKQVDYNFNSPYPYLVVNIGSGVSMLAVYSATSYSRVYGSNIGGGTFEGLCCSLTQRQLTFEEAISLAQAGDANRVNKLVRDIYGGDYTKFDLKGDLVASSFGNMNNTDKRIQAKPEDHARGVLEMVTLNIASQARLCAKCEKINRVVFIGNFLRVNQLSTQLLAYAFDYWSKGEIKALFLGHEGYFGALQQPSQTEELSSQSDISTILSPENIRVRRPSKSLLSSSASTRTSCESTTSDSEDSDSDSSSGSSFDEAELNEISDWEDYGAEKTRQNIVKICR